MKIFFSATTHKIEELGKYYVKIRDHLVSNGNVLVHDWLPNVTEDRKTFSVPDILQPSEYKKAIQAIDDAELLIFETTQPSFSTGHLMTLGIQRKVPILVMWLDDSAWSKRRGMIEGIESEYLELSEYNEDDYKEILDAFINKYGDPQLKHRFNLVLDDAERQYLDWLSYQTFKSRTKLLREMIRCNLEEDAEYSSFLSKNGS
jgi:hypothetical protein